MRVEAGAFRKRLTAGGECYLHHVTAEQAASMSAAAFVRRFKPVDALAPAEHRDAVYTDFLSGLTLTKKHADDLRERRGLSEETIAKGLYASVQAAAKHAVHVARIAGAYTLSGVAGFYRNERDEWRWWSEASSGELFIPVCDRQGRITAILRGTDGDPKYLWFSNADRGPSCGTPLHFARPYLAELHPNDPVIITEGALKADIIAEHLHVTVIGVAGVGSIAPLGAELDWLARRRVLVAFDADADPMLNPHVWKALVRLFEKLSAAGVTFDRLRWDMSLGKGLDDVLVRGAA